MGNVIEAIANFWDSVATRFETASRKAQIAAEDAKPAAVLIDDLQAAADMRSRRINGAADDVLTQYRVQEKIALWAKQAKDAAEKAKALPEGDPKRETWLNLARQALQGKAEDELQLKPILAVVESSRPAYERAIAAGRRVGYEEAQLRSTSRALQIESLSADMRLQMSQVAGELDQAGDLTDLVKKAQRKVDLKVARAEAVEERQSLTPPTNEQAEYTLAQLNIDGKVEDELAALMADAPKAPATPAADSAPAAA